jgi:hypothetical protein
LRAVTSSERPDSIHIDDLANPQFVPEVVEIMESVKPIADSLDLSPAALVEQARTDTGLHDLGDQRRRGLCRAHQRSRRQVRKRARSVRDLQRRNTDLRADAERCL